mgnify:CR=1 FL=1
MNKFKIGKKIISDNKPTYFIADIGANHDGSLEKAKELIYLCAESGADAAKFQHFSAKTIVSDFGFKSLKGKFSHQSKWKKSVFEVYQDASINLNWTRVLKKTCEKVGIEFFSSPYSYEMVNHLNPFVSTFKIGSGDITWLDYLEFISKKNKPIILATGASTLREVKLATNKILKKNKKLVLMQCNTNYTASNNNLNYVNLNVLKIYKKLFPKIILGLSDHTFGHTAVLGAVTLGARVIEKHFTDDNKRTGPDHKFSMNPITWKNMVNATRELELTLGSSLKKIEKNENQTVILQRRSIRLKSSIDKNQVIRKDNLVFLRPCPKDAYLLENYKNIIGKKIKRKIKSGDYIKKSDFR